MKKHLLKSFALLAMLFSALTMSAVSYCGEQVQSTIDNKSVSIGVTILKVGDALRVSFDSEYISGIRNGGTFQQWGNGVWANEADAVANFKEGWTQSGTTWTKDFTFSTYPTSGVGKIYCLFNIVNAGNPPVAGFTLTDIDLFNASCDSSGEGGEDPAIEHPSPAPVPTVPAKQVFSIYSNAYTSAVNRTMGYWNQTTQEQEVQLAEGDKAFYYTNCNYLGWELHSKYDMTAYPMLHMDVYVVEAGSIGFTPIWGGEAEKAYALQAGWNAIDIDLTADFAAINLATIDQLKWANMPATCYIDNVYFFNDGTTEPVEPTPVKSNYCQNTLTNGANSIDLTCEKVSVGNYRIIIEGSNLGQNGMDNATSGSFIIVNNEKTENITKGSQLKQYINTTLSTTSKVICEVPSTVDPKFDGNLYIMMPGEVNFGPVSDVIWGTCPEAEEDDQAPTMTSATVESYTHNSAVIAVAASDNVGVAKYQIVDAGNSVDQTLTATDGKITLSGLASATIYNLTIYAIDKAGNKSDGFAVAAFTTDALVYCDFPMGHQNNANYDDANGRCLLTLTKLSDTKVRVSVKPNYANGSTKKIDYLYVTSPNGNPYPATAGAHATEGGYEELSVDISYASTLSTYSYSIQWSNVNDGTTTWLINVDNVLESNLCPLPTDDEAPVMVSASLGSVTHNSAVLSVSATDNDEVANYHVVDDTNNYDETIAPVGDQITLTDLTPSTTYNFTVTAVDLAGNESANNKTIVVTTDALVYCDFPTGHEGNANFGNANGRCLLTLTKLGNTQIRITVKPNYDNGATQKLDFLYVVANGANPNPATVGDPNLSEGGVDALSVDINYQTLTYPIGSIEIKWSTIGMDGEWATTVTNILESNLCLPIIVDENTDPATLPNGATCDVQFAREMTVVNDIWNTIALPFGMNAEQIARTFGEGTLVAKLQHSSSVASLEEMKLRFDYVDEIEAGTPYIILPMESGKDVVISGVTINTTTNPIVANQVTMHPVLETISYNYDNGDPIKFFLAADGYLHYNEASNQIKGLRAYFTFDNVTTIAQASKVRARIVFDENTETSVDNITMDEVPVKVIQHGQLIIIRNGVKYNVQGQKL